MRTASRDLHDDAVETLSLVLHRMGLESHASGGKGADLVLDGPNGPVGIAVKAASFADPSRTATLVRSYARGGSNSGADDVAVVVLVADDLPSASRDVLREQGWGYLDRRGRMWLRTDGILINDTDLEPVPRHGVQIAALDPFTGRVGLGMAVWMLMHSDQHPTVRMLAHELNCATSTAHDALRRLRDAALIEPDGGPLTPELFWAVADRWRPQRHYVVRVPEPDDRDLAFNLDDRDTQGWAMSGDLAAAAWGARLSVTSGMPPDFYVPSAILRRAVRELGPTDSSSRGASLAVAPLTAATRERFDRASPSTTRPHWLLAHPVIVALDLAQDRSRGREILAGWEPPDEFNRVW